MRLQKYLAQSGVASRRKSEEYIRKGYVKVNGNIITDMGFIVDINNDIVTYHDKTVHLNKDYIYIMLNKPPKVLSTVSDDRGRRVVTDFIKNRHSDRLYPVGRLDYDTTGLILLTNDGELTNKLTHPKSNIYKTYIAAVQGKINRNLLNRLEDGVIIDGKKTNKSMVKFISYKDGVSIVRISINQGMNRQIRKMFEIINHPVLSLSRIKVGELELGDLSQGEWRYLTKEEKKYLKNL